MGMTNSGVPHKCPRCCVEEIETPDGNAIGFYGRLVFSKDPKPALCANCQTELVPSGEYDDPKQVDNVPNGTYTPMERFTSPARLVGQDGRREEGAVGGPLAPVGASV